jgi:tRNA(His) guanylyltransferase
MKDFLGDRMKIYENVNRNYLPIRTPMIIRLDGKSFSSYTKNFEKPWSKIILDTFIYSSTSLFEEISGLKLIYGQSDELSLLITDYDTLNTKPWFDKNIQKIVSVSASIITAAFNKYLNNSELQVRTAFFDSRVFTLPKEEVCNYFIFRQRDAISNSITCLAQQYFSHNQLEGLSSKEKKAILFDIDQDWDECETWQKRGFCVTRELFEKDVVIRHKIKTDWNIPVFSENRNYIEKFVYLEEKSDV